MGLIENCSQLPGRYRVYIRDPKERSWDRDRYCHLTEISTVDELLSGLKTSKKMWRHVNYFFFRQETFPDWEDPNNRKGGTISYKVYEEDVDDNVIATICTLVFGEPEYSWVGLVQGVSVTKKFKHYIVRIWVSRYTDDAIDDLAVPSYSNKMYKRNQ